MKKKLAVCILVLMSFFSFAHHVPGNLSFSGHPFLLKDTLDPEIKAANRSAKKAMLLSTMLPGLGQAYNHKYWKIPVIYAAAGGFTWFAIQNNMLYKRYSNALRVRFDGDPATVDKYDGIYSDESLVNLKKTYKKRRDLLFIGAGAVYLVNIIDANVDAHLKQFDKKINEDVSLSIRPTSNVIMTYAKPVYYSGIRLKLSF